MTFVYCLIISTFISSKTIHYCNKMIYTFFRKNRLTQLYFNTYTFSIFWTFLAIISSGILRLSHFS